MLAKTLRGKIQRSAISSKSDLKALLISSINLSFLLITFFSLVNQTSATGYIIFMFLNGLSISLCFVVAHDLCHNALFKTRWLNELWGRIIFAPSLTPFSPWHLEHNIMHHNFTNLKEADVIWMPLSVAEFNKLSFFQQQTYKFERSFLGCPLHWIRSFWLPKMIIKVTKSRSKLAKFDLILALSYIPSTVFVAGVLRPDLNFIQSFFLYFFLPHIVFCQLAGFVTYVQHTNTKTKWYNSKEEWSFYKGAIESTVHVKFPKFIDFLFHRVMHHNAHHVNASIPMYNLVDAQKDLKEKLGPDHNIPEVTFTIREYLNDCYKCKLYDYDTHTWYSFKEAEEAFSAQSEKNKAQIVGTSKTISV